MKGLNRRNFLKLAGCGAMSTVAMSSAIADMGLMGALSVAGSQPVDDYRALVCIFLLGGNDSFNMLVPAGDRYGEYVQARGTLALPQNSILRLNRAPDFGLHPSMPNLKVLFDEGQAAFVANVGTLLAPVDRLAWLRKSTRLPDQLFSHNTQQRQWQTSVYDSDSRTGWAGRMVDLLQSVDSTSPLSSNISITSTGNFLQVGNRVTFDTVLSSGPVSIRHLESARAGKGTQASRDAYQALLDLYQEDYRSNFFLKAYADRFNLSLGKAEFVENSLLGLTNYEDPSAPFPQSPLGEQLQMVSRLIAARDVLGAKRQTFFVALGGFDTHGNQLEEHSNLLKTVDDAILAFARALQYQGVSQNVTTFSASDFGRTFSPNSSGSDHGWGGNQFVFGGSVAGGQVYGTYPQLIIGGPDDTDRGRWIPTTSVDEFSAGMARWFGGFSQSQLFDIFPNLRNFEYTSGLPMFR